MSHVPSMSGTLARLTFMCTPHPNKWRTNMDVYIFGAEMSYERWRSGHSGLVLAVFRAA
jgi:hypothetical protein